MLLFLLLMLRANPLGMLLVGQKSRVQLIVTFLSILELMKMGYIHVEQDALFDDILVEVVREPQEWTHLTEFADE